MRIGLGLSIPELATRGGRFSPASLFTGGVAGAWYDPSDTSTLFQDSAGTTPVTAVEQPVGLMLDKSQGLVLGSEQVTVPYVAVGTNWTSTGTSVSATDTSVARNGGAQLIGTLSSGKKYRVSFVASNLSGQTCYLTLDSSVSALTKRIASAGSYSFILDGSGVNSLSFSAYEGGWFNVTLSNISVKELPGNHARAPNDPSRPILRARYNNLTYSEQFNNVAWLNANSGLVITANDTTAPDGTLTADKLQPNTDSRIYQNITSAGTNTISVYAKPNGLSWINIRMRDSGGTDRWAWFNISNGTLGTVDTGLTVSITAASNGFYRCVASLSSVSTASAPYMIGVVNANNAVSYAPGSDMGSVWVWGADLRTGSSAGTYQRIAAATDYATAGFLPYLAADGTDDNMVIPATAISGATAMTEMHAAWRPAGFGAGNGVVFGGTGTGLTNDHEPFSDGNLYYGFASSSRQDFGSLGTVTTPYLLDATQTGTTLAAFRNGTQLSTIKTVSIGIGTTPRLFVSNNSTLQYYQGNFFGGLIIKKVLSAAETSASRSWFAAKAGITL